MKKIKPESVELTVNGITAETDTLDRDRPRAIYYAENEDVAAELSEGMTAAAAATAYKRRAALYLFNTAIALLNEISETDPAAADELADAFTDALTAGEDDEAVYIGGGVYCTPNALLVNSGEDVTKIPLKS